MRFDRYSLGGMKHILRVGLTSFLIVALDNMMLILSNMVFQKYGWLITCTATLQSFMVMIAMPLGGITSGT